MPRRPSRPSVPSTSATYSSPTPVELPSWETEVYPFDWLLFHLELLIFSPFQNTQESINNCVKRRLQLFAAGHIEQLWAEVLQVVSRPPGSAPPKPTSTKSINKAAQAAADVYNYRTAYARATANTPIAIINQATLQNTVRKLYPAPIPPSLRPPKAPVRPTSTTPHPATPHFELPGDIIKTIRQAPRGKANGFQMDSMDMFISLAKLNNADIHANIIALFTRFYNGNVHPLIVPYFTSTYLFCLHKDPDDPTKLRPIGVPTALRRILASHIAKTFRVRFARHLLPYYNYAIKVPNGMDFIVKTIQLQVDRFITQPQAAGRSPSRCLISLDLRNMFNEVSRDEILHIVHTFFPELLPLVTMLYNDAGDVWIRLEDGTWATIAMEEGTNQGCPLSSTLAALVLHSILAPITQLLHQRAAERLAAGDPGDDGLGGVSNPLAYVDDKNSCVYLPDVLFFLEEFQRRAPFLGLYINTIKTRILTSTNGDSAIPAIRREYGRLIATQIQQAIASFSNTPSPTATNPKATTPVEVTTGLRVLGQPVGSPAFATEFLATAISRVEDQVSHLLTSLEDKHTLMRLFIGGAEPNRQKNESPLISMKFGGILGVLFTQFMIKSSNPHQLDPPDNSPLV
eukprot:scaffold22773_cov35-Cyclotella_meneghiniana.AAC.1